MIYLNGKQPNSMFVGDKQIERVMYADRLVWENVKVLPLGTGTTFDVSAIYSDYANLTADNFFIGGIVGTPSFTGSVTGQRPSGVDMGGYGRLVKSYNATTGVMTMYYAIVPKDNISSATASVYGYFVPDVAKAVEKGKMKYLGSGRSFSVSAIEGYKNFSTKNFIIQSLTQTQFGARYYEGSFSCAGYCQVPMSYNTSNGIFTTGNNTIITESGGGYIESSYQNAQVYFIEKARE